MVLVADGARRCNDFGCESRCRKSQATTEGEDQVTAVRGLRSEASDQTSRDLNREQVRLFDCGSIAADQGCGQEASVQGIRGVAERLLRGLR